MGRDKDRQRSLKEDERAIEGLPIRLVIALFIGVASLFLMTQVLGIFDSDQLQRNELTTDIEQGSVIGENGGNNTLTFTIVNGEGKPISDVQKVILEPDTAQGSTVTLSLSNSTANKTVSDFRGKTSVKLGPNQNSGKYTLRPVDPTGEFDNVEPAKITIVDS
jgi:hypothetical protein